MKFDVVIVGGGAAGLFCAIEAGKRGRRVLVIEKNAQVGRKIVISGGGRCNFTNIHTSHENFISNNPHFCKSALARYTPQDFIELVQRHRIDFYEKKLGQLFCRESSREIVDMLLKECRRSRVEVRTSAFVTSIGRAEHFELETSLGRIVAESVVIATGGLSFAKIGATDFGYRIASQFGLKIEPTRPSLVPLKFQDRAALTGAGLPGISVDSVVSTNGHSFRENILFTHRGLSGPAILQISNYWERSTDVAINLLPERDATQVFDEHRRSRRTLANVLGQLIPDRLASAFAPRRLVDTSMNQISTKDLGIIAEKLNDWHVRFSETEGYDRAEVTLGGVATSELSSQTMEAKKVPGLFFVGEVVDVTGWLGGYNFQWAWASGYAAGQTV